MGRKRRVAEKRLEIVTSTLPIIPNAETIKAIEAVRRGGVHTVRSVDELLVALNRNGEDQAVI